MDAHLFRLFASRLAPILEGAWIEKFQEPVDGLLAMSFYGAGRKRRLYLRYNRKAPFLFLSDDRLAAPQNPSGEIMRLRRYFGERRIAGVVPQFCSRKLWLLAADAVPNGRLAWLCLDLANGPSIHFLQPDETPEIESPKWPEPPQQGLDDWQAWPVLTPALRRTLATQDELDKWALIQDLRAGNGDVFLYKDKDSRVEQISAWPLPKQQVKNLTLVETSDVLEAVRRAGADMVLAKIHAEESSKIYLPAQKRLRQLEKTLKKLEEDAKKLAAMANLEEQAKALQANLWRLPQDTRTDILEFEDDNGQMRVFLDKRFNIQKNMERMFHKVRRGKRGLAMLATRREAISAEMAALSGAREYISGNIAHPVEKRNEKEGRLEALAKGLPKTVQAFLSSDGYILLRGKDARGNRAIRRLASPRDLWAHVENGPGAHVIIRRENPAQEVPETTLMEAGALAAYKSWLNSSASANITFAEVRHIKPSRNGPDGKVIIDKVQFTRLVPVNATLEKTGISGKA